MSRSSSDGPGNGSHRGLKERSEAGPGRREQHAYDNDGKNECVLDERLTLRIPQARRQSLKQGHWPSPFAIRTISPL